MKGNLLLGTARGKLGDVVMYRQRGKQMARVRITKVSNPRTLAQVVQRVVFNTAIQAYSKMQDICNHSFQGMERSVENQAEFMRLNVRILNDYIASQDNPALAHGFLQRHGQGLMFQPWQISKGNLPAPTIGAAGEETLDLFNHNSTTTGVDLYALSYGAVAELLGVPYGSQITVCLLTGYPDEVDETMGFSFGRFVLMPSEGDADTPFFVKHEPTSAIGINSPNPANTINLFSLGGNAETGYRIFFDFSDSDVVNSSSFYGWSTKDSNVAGFSLITSQYVNKTWRRSSSFVQPMSVYLGSFPQKFWSLQDAAESWAEGVWSSKYLNKGENPYNDSVVEDEWNGIKERYPNIAAINEDAAAIAAAEDAEAIAEGVLTRKRRRKSDD